MNQAMFNLEQLTLASTMYAGSSPPKYRYPPNMAVLCHHMENILAVVGDSEHINGEHKEAERVALALVNQNKTAIAFKIFKAITRNKDIILFTHSNPVGGYVSEETSPVSGKLGYEGVYQFGLLALKYQENELAKRLFLEIAEKIPNECQPVYLQDIRTKCLQQLIVLRVMTVNNMSTEEAYRAANSL